MNEEKTSPPRASFSLVETVIRFCLEKKVRVFIAIFLAAGWGILSLMKAITQLPLAMTPAMALGVFVGTVVFSALSGFVATRKLVAADPADLF